MSGFRLFWNVWRGNTLFCERHLASILRTGIGKDNRLSPKLVSASYGKILHYNCPFRREFLVEQLTCNIPQIATIKCEEHWENLPKILTL